MSGTMSNLTRAELVLLTNQNGIAVIPSPTPLTRLNYFDGKFLRAEDMQAEQLYLRTLVQLSNRGGGSGVVNGFDTVLSAGGDSVTISPGLAFDANGRTLLLPMEKALDLATLIRLTTQATPNHVATAAGSADFADCVVTDTSPMVNPTQTADLYLLTVGFLEAACGEEDVLGKICEEACATGKDRRYRVEGVVFRALPLSLSALPYVTIKSVSLGAKHLRSRVASAYYADERARIASLISGAGIRSGTWCLGAAAEIGGDVPLAVFSRSGEVTHFLDAWTARRERIDTPPRRYWAWRMAMRPWEVFLAQILQFQCQLHDVLLGIGDGPNGGGDPCANERKVIAEASLLIGQLEQYHAALADTLTSLRAAGNTSLATVTLFPEGLAAIAALRKNLGTVNKPGGTSDRILIDGGIVEVPSAGYLPVVPGTEITVNEQVRRLMGPGVDLRFCIVTPDYVPHALEEAQHMDRISLIEGLDDPKKIPPVDVLVPNGTFALRSERDGRYFEVKALGGTDSRVGTIRGAGHGRSFKTGGGAFYFAGRVDDVSSIAFTNVRANLAALLNVEPVIEDAAPVAPAPAPPTTFAARVAAWRPILTNPIRTLTINATDAASARILPAEYAEMSIVDDPFQLGQHESTDAGFRLIGTLRNALTDIDVHGPFTVATPAADIGNDTQLVTGTWIARVSVTLNGTPGQSPPFVEFAVEARRQIKAGSGFVDIKLVPRGFAVSTNDIAGRAAAATGLILTVRHEWQGSPLSGKLTGSLLANVDQGGISEVDLLENPNVAERSNPAHIMAESALDAIATPLKQSQWREAAEQNLFPQPDATNTVDVLAILDWVLFHKRRVKNCTAERVAPANRRFDVYVFDVTQFDGFNPFRQRLLSNNPKDIAFVSRVAKKIDTVQFTAGQLDRGDLAAQDLKNFSSGLQVLWAGIGMNAPQDPFNTELDRLTQYEGAIAGVSDITMAQGPEILVARPPALVDPGSDGVIVLLTNALEEKVSTWRIRPEVVNVDLDARLKGIPNPFTSEIALPLGPVSFRGPGANANAADLASMKQHWKDDGGGLARAAYVFFATSQSSSGPPPTATARATALDKELGGVDPVSLTTQPTSSAIPDSATLAVLLVPTLPVTLFLMNSGQAGSIDKIWKTGAPTPTMDEAKFQQILPLITSLGTYNVDLGTGLVVEASALTTQWTQVAQGRFLDQYFPSWADDAPVSLGGPLSQRASQAIIDVLAPHPAGTPPGVSAGMRVTGTTRTVTAYKDAPLVIFLYTPN
jgi:hypothetical protein